MNSLDTMHRAVAAWFARRFAAPTDAQLGAWAAIQAGHDVLVAAPTGSGKTLAAFLAAIDELIRDGVAGTLPDETRILYVSPLKALSNDIQRNLEEPLAGIRAELESQGGSGFELRALVRTGDTPPSDRVRMRQRPPHILVTTPESLYVLLGSDSGRKLLSTCRKVIVDEIHAIAGGKRGLHLALSLERLQALVGARLVRIGLSATQTPIAEVARLLSGSNADDGACVIVDSGHVRRRDLALELTGMPLEPVMSGEAWTLVYDRLAQLVRRHRTTLVFVNTRRLAERVARHLADRLGDGAVAAHHGSLAKERRFDAEQRLKRGELQVLVATASLELGLDIGAVDLVCQLGSTRSINALLQRVGRAGHSLGGIAKGRVFPLSRDDLLECAALLDAVRRGELDRISIPVNSLDVLSQQIVAEVAAREWSVDELFDRFRRAYPYRTLPRCAFDDCVSMLANGFATRRGRRAALIHHDAVNGLLRARKGARLTALTGGGAIPDNADYRVLLEPEGLAVGTVNEDFAVESLQGDVFQLGNVSYKILRVERGTVRVEDARGQTPSIPFWLGEAPGRTDQLSRAVSRLRCEVASRLGEEGGALRWLTDTVGLDDAAATELTEYLAAGRAALGGMPTQDTVVIERFFDESGGMQLVIHSPFGSRVNRAWGLSLRKRFCRTFNFELQAAATEDHIVLSLTQAHSFELTGVGRYLQSNSVRDLLVQALCAAPMFAVRWRWDTGIALALPRFRGGRKVAPQIARMNAEDLLAAVFPDQTACAENLPGEIEIPRHPLVDQTIRDCLEEAMDIHAFEAVLRGIEAGRIAVLARDLTQPSPFALEALCARPYAFLDDAPLEERRTQAVMARRWIDAASAAEFGRLDGGAIARVRDEAWPDAATADELCDALACLTFLTDAEIRARPDWPPLIDALVATGRVARVSAAAGRTLWSTVERLPLFAAAVPASDLALREITRGRLQGLGPVTAARLAVDLGVSVAAVETALAALESEGSVLRGRFTTPATEEEWCERGLLARIHRYTVKRLRAEIEPVAVRDYLRFLFDWQHVVPEARLRGPDSLAVVLAQLEGFEASAGAWESDILPARIIDYDPHWLDELCRSGRFVWARLEPARREPSGRAGPLRSTPLALIGRRNFKAWSANSPAAQPTNLSSRASDVLEVIRERGASFFDDIADDVSMLPVEVEAALAELVAHGLVNSDSFTGLRSLLTSAQRRGAPVAGSRSRRRPAVYAMADAGRWALVARPAETGKDESAVETVVRGLLRRWGLIFWKLLAREAAWLPSWRDISLCCRRLEARGEIRGGRFVGGVSGEQYALPEAVAALRDSRRRPAEARYVAVCGADPLNLAGILLPGARVPSLKGNRVVYLDGAPVAMWTGGSMSLLADLDPDSRRRTEAALLGRIDATGAAAARRSGGRVIT